MAAGASASTPRSPGDIAGSLEIAHASAPTPCRFFPPARACGRAALREYPRPTPRAFAPAARRLQLGPLVDSRQLPDQSCVRPTRSCGPVRCRHSIRKLCAPWPSGPITGGPSGLQRNEPATVALSTGDCRHRAGAQTGGARIEARRPADLPRKQAGQGNSIGSQFEELAPILDACRELPLGVCIDTAHLFAAGWDIRTEAGSTKRCSKSIRTVGLDRVRRDSRQRFEDAARLARRPPRAHRQGQDRPGSLRRILNHPLLAGRAFIAETPIDKPGDDRKNVAALWKLGGPRESPRPATTDMKPRKKSAKPAKAKASANESQGNRAASKPGK